ncbi:ABC transporter permease [Mycetocola tolaasinivorans]|uniref:ABC transporter permease n=1 Tax=Mycetocola tolaasinivorans TaxID=76635 RepID=A0A3L7A408_9MICO|nr:ABC transporter permease [Mycetocola tolaasinivorans]RLP75029.1 ABC transporter permease [Mycetocola tolaasinivorans]
MSIDEREAAAEREISVGGTAPAERDERAARLPDPFTPQRRSLRERIGRPRIAVVLSVVWLILVVLWALFPSVFTPFDPIAGNAAEAQQAPSLAHPFGTDATGRDMFSRVVYGSINSLSGALIAVSVGFVIGTAIGVFAGSSRRLVDDILMRIVDVFLAIPSLLLSLSIIILLGFGTAQAAIAVGFTSVAAFARLSRSEVVRVRGTDYVEAAFASGGRFLPVLWRHVLPNSLNAVLALAALQFGTAVLSISTLGFLGYGAPPPTPEWGLMIAEGRNYVATAWWLTTLPGAVVVLVVLSANRVSAAIAARGRIS